MGKRLKLLSLFLLIVLLLAAITTACGSEQRAAPDGRTQSVSATVGTGPTVSTTTPAGASYSFAVCGDNRDDGIKNGVLGRIVDSAKARGADFIVDTGDVTTDGSREQLRLYRDFTESSGITFYTVPGNHDVGQGGISGSWEEVMGPQYYFSFDHGGDHFVILNNADDRTGIPEEEMNWYIADLEANRNDRNTFIFTHIPVSSSGLPQGHVAGELGKAGRESGERMVAESARARTRAFFFGHIHAYLRYQLNGVPAYITGGAGARLHLIEILGGYYHYLLVTVSGEDINVEVVRV
jgi:predicted phosphodiesterase